MDYSFLKIKNRKTTVFLICIGISAFFWLLTKLSQEYEINVDIPVVFHNYPDNLILVNKPDSIIQVRITDNGFDLIGISIFGAPKSIEMNIPDMRVNKSKSSFTQSFTLVRTKLEELNQIFGSAKNLRLLGPDSLVLRFEKLATKKIIIIPQVEYLLLPQFQIKGKPELQPNFITVYGSQSSLDKIDTIYTETKLFTDLDKSFTEKIQLLLPDYMNADFKSTELVVEIEKFTEAKINIPIPLDFIKNKNVRLFPKTIDIKYTVSFKDFNNINSSDFKVKASEDFLEVGKLNIFLEEYPAGIRIIDYQPKVAEFIIIK